MEFRMFLVIHTTPSHNTISNYTSNGGCEYDRASRSTGESGWCVTVRGILSIDYASSVSLSRYELCKTQFSGSVPSNVVSKRALVVDCIID